MISATIKGGKQRITFSAIASGSVSKYQCVYQYTNNSVKKASNVDFTQALVVGISLQDLVDGQRGNFLVLGELQDSSWTFTAGSDLYIDVNGALTHTISSGGAIISLVGMAVSSTKIFFNIDKTIIKTS